MKSNIKFVLLVLLIIVGLLYSSCDYKGVDTEADCSCTVKQVIKQDLNRDTKMLRIVVSGKSSGYFNFETSYPYQIGDTVIK